ncbi:MAG TPA: ABC transporter permease, partial [Longimicrobium sp.]
MKSGLSWLDVKLGVRMLFKYPGLTLVGGLGMALAIGVGAGMFAFMYAFMFPRLPLDEGHRIVAIENWDLRRDNQDRRSLHDLAAWRTELRTVREVSAFRDVDRNHIAPDGTTTPVALAEITASGFRVARVAPALGRYLVDEDEMPGAQPVVVIGHDVWRTRFAADPRIVGRTVRLGNVMHTVVGVMPRGYAFPVNHDWWIPFRLTPSDHPRGGGPELHVFGRLAPGATQAQAQAELDAVGRRTAAAFPQTHATLRPRVMDYAHPFGGVQDVSVWEMTAIQGMISLLLVVVAVNVSILVYARTAMRRGEIAIRTALGASRRRIVGQLFVEALVLSGIAALMGLGLGQAGMGLAFRIQELDGGGAIPFWMDARIPAPTVVYAVGMAVLAAVIAGVLPALGVTGRRMQDSLRQLGGGTGLQLGRTWTVLIVAQVGFAVAAIPIALGVTIEEVGEVLTRPRFDVDRYLVASVAADREPPTGVEAEAYGAELGERFADAQGELLRRLRAEPWAGSVTVGSGLPSVGGWTPVEMDGPPRQVRGGNAVSVSHVDSSYFGTYGATLLAGRPLRSGDVDTASTAVVV